MSRSRVGPLDGVRGIALVAVLGYHVAPTTIQGGFLGVDMFFVLSGFLLTTLLLEEHGASGEIDFGAYAMRRARRILPALLVLLGALVLIVPLLATDGAHRLRDDVLWSLGGLTNWHLIFEGDSYFARFGRPPFVRHLWSIAVELQFYVVCPFAVLWLARRRRGVAIAAGAAGVAGSSVLMALLYRAGDPSRAYFGTDTRAGALLAGVLLAVVLGHGRHSESQKPLAGSGALAGVALLTLAVLVAVAGQPSRGSYPAVFLIAAGATSLLIASSLHPGWAASLLDRPALRWLGTRSYGIYLWHWPLVALLRPGATAGWPAVAAALVTIPGALVLGALSYHLVERPLLSGWSLRAQRPDHAVAICLAGVTMAALIGVMLATMSTDDPLAKALDAGERVLMAQAPPTTAATSTTTTTEPPTTTTVTVSPPSTPAPAPAVTAAAPRRVEPPPPQPVLSPLPPGSVAVTAIGDSVMVTAAGALRARLGDSGHIDAKQNRHFSHAAEVARGLRERGALGQVVVVHLGNNGPVRASEVDALMNELQGVTHVLVVTVRVNRSWEGSVNQVLRESAGRYPSIKIVDWYSYSAGHGEWFQGDGTHFKTTSGPGANAYADLIAGSIPAPAPTTTTPPPAPTTLPPPAVIPPIITLVPPPTTTALPAGTAGAPVP